MRIDAAFFGAAHKGTELRCLGLPLMPYSLGHQILLRATSNAALIGMDPTFEDLVSGVFICSRTWEDFQSAVQSKKFHKQVKRWGILADNAVKRGRLNLAHEAVKFREYVKAGMEEPDANHELNEGGRRLGSPWEARLKVWLMSNFPQLSESEILNRPLQLNNAEYATKAELEGIAELFNKDDEAAFKLAKQLAQEEGKS